MNTKVANLQTKAVKLITCDDFSVIVTVCRGPGALGIYSTHGTPSFMHHYGFKKGIRAVSCPYPTPILH